MTKETVLLRKTLAAIRDEPYEKAHALPGEFYTSADWLNIERDELFRNQWLCVGRVEEVSGPGDYMAFDLAGEPVVVAHGADGVIRALSNVCRHRGARLLPEAPRPAGCRARYR